MEYYLQFFRAGKRLCLLVFFLISLSFSDNYLHAQCCTDNVLSDGGFEAAISVDEKFPNASLTSSNNAQTVKPAQWSYDDGTNDVNPTTIIDASRASEGNQFGYIPKPSTPSTYNNCIGNGVSYTSSYTCQSDYYTTGVRYIASFDYMAFNPDAPAGGTGVMTPIMEFQAPGVFNTLDIYDNSGNLLNVNETAVAWSNVASSWKTANALIPAVATTGYNIVWFSHHKDGTCGMLFDNSSLVMIELQSHGLDDVAAGSNDTEIDFTLNPGNNVTGLPGILYEVVAPSGYTVTPTSGIYNQETSFTLSINSGDFASNGGGEIYLEVRDEVNTGCSVTATIANPFSSDNDNIPSLVDFDDDNDGISDAQELCGTAPLPLVTSTPVDITINLDDYPEETTWAISGPSGQVYSGGPYSSANIPLSGSLDLSENGAYTLTLSDSYGDGTSGNTFSINGADFTTITNTFTTGYSSVINFTVTSISTNTFSCLSADPFADSDNDGTLNFKDADFCTLNANGVCASMDADGDGIINSLDKDSDNDGIPDMVEEGLTDSNGDGMLDVTTDVDGDGLMDAYDEADGGSGAGEVSNGISLGTSNKDGDGLANYLDIDSDNDGVTDIVENAIRIIRQGLIKESHLI